MAIYKKKDHSLLLILGALEFKAISSVNIK